MIMILKNIAAHIDGTLTDIILGNYENKLLIIITQTKKFGPVIRVEREIFKALDSQENVFNIQTLFGKENNEHCLIVRILCEKIETTKPIIFIVNLKDNSPRTMRALIQILIENKKLSEKEMTIFGQLVIGPPGSGKSTYCREVKTFLQENGRKVAIINFDPANDILPYIADIDISEYTTTEDVMNFLHVGPNCAILFCIEFLERCAQKIAEEIEKKKDHYFLIDCPGQVELYTHHEALKNILKCFEKIDLRLCCVHLVDSHYCSDAGKFISTLLLSLSSMLHMELPHVNLLSKIDLLEKFSNRLSFTLDYYTDVLDLSHLVESLDEDPITSKYKKLNGALASFIEDYSLVHFTPLNVRDRRSLLNVQNLVDKANGYIFKCEEERNIHKLLSSVMVNAENDTNVETEDTCHPEEGPESTLFNYTL